MIAKLLKHARFKVKPIRLECTSAVLGASQGDLCKDTKNCRAKPRLQVASIFFLTGSLALRYVLHCQVKACLQCRHLTNPSAPGRRVLTLTQPLT